jgi:Right handed beta helix region
MMEKRTQAVSFDRMRAMDKTGRAKELLRSVGRSVPFWLVLFALGLPARSLEAAIIEVNGPGESIQAAIDSANNDDIILIAPGTYVELLQIAEKRVTLASCFYTTGDPDCIENTILQGIGPFHNLPYVIQIRSSAPDGSRFIGLTIENGSDGIHSNSRFEIRDSVVRLCGDGLDYNEGAGGLVINTLIEENFEDGIDINGIVDVTIEDSIIRNNLDEGIEVRLDDQGTFVNPLYPIIIRGNTISGNAQDGIQLINSSTLTPREVTIDGNILADNLRAGVGMLCCDITVEDFQGAAFDEPISVTNNTFYGNDHGLTGGGNLVVLNNLFLDSANIGLKNATSGAVVAHNLFYGNGTDWLNSDVDLPTTWTSDPLIDSDFDLGKMSPAIDVGTAHYEIGGVVLFDVPSEEYSGVAPDLGARESGEALPALPALSLPKRLLVVAMFCMAGALLTRRTRRRSVR